MKLLTEELKKQLPSLGQGTKKAYVKFFAPWSNWTWYGCEYDPEQRLFFGYVEGLDNEWGYFSLDELELVTGPMGLKIERDLYWKPQIVG